MASIELLFAAIEAGDVEAVGDPDRLIELVDGDPSLATAFSADGFSPLHLAAFIGSADVARVLLERGADVDARGHGWMTGTALHSATSSNHVAIARLLLEGGADPNARRSGGWTPLHSAVAQRQRRAGGGATRPRRGPCGEER